MDKENRIFVLGFFWLILGGISSSLQIYQMINGTWGHVWYEWGLFIAVTSCMIDGLVKVTSVTKSDGAKVPEILEKNEGEASDKIKDELIEKLKQVEELCLPNGVTGAVWLEEWFGCLLCH